MTHLTLVGKFASRTQPWTNVLLFDERELRVGAGNELLRKTDVEHANLAEIRLVVGQEHRQFQVAERQRQVGLDDVGTHVVGVVLGHQSRRNVDAHDLAGRLVDVFRQRRETTRKRFVQSRTKKSVDDERISIEFRRVEVERHLREILDTVAVAQPFFVNRALVRQIVVDIE